MESFASGLKRIQRFCDEAGCKVEFQTIEAGFVVCFYRKNATDSQSKPRKTQEKTQEITLPISDIILDFCKTPKSKAEIMEYCGYKSKKRFTANYLKPLLDTGKLVMTNPENPKNRNQKYITV